MVSTGKKPDAPAPAIKKEVTETEESRHIEAKSNVESKETAAVAGRSSIRREKTSPEAARMEAEVLLAYEQYDEALQLLADCRQNFGADDWIDLKTLEIYAASNQCEKFLALFNEKRKALQTDPKWEKIEKMRDRLCAEFKISAIG